MPGVEEDRARIRHGEGMTGLPDENEAAGRRRRRVLIVTLLLSALSMFARVAVATHSAFLGVASLVVLGGFFWWLIARSRTKTEAEIEHPSDGAVSMKAGLDFASLPQQWRSWARETLGPAAGSARAMSVTVGADDGWLVVEKRRQFGAGKTPFQIRVPLAALAESRAAKPKIGLVGSSITLALSTGDELVFDIMAGLDAATTVARRFGDAATSARGFQAPGPLALEVTTGSPPARTSPGMAGLLMMACVPPFAIAMAGAVDGTFADIGSVGLIFAALGLMFLRPVRMARYLAVGAWATAAAFGLDAIVTGQMLRVVGVACCIALAVWMGSREPSPSPS
jgi:hypothetical protein